MVLKKFLERFQNNRNEIKNIEDGRRNDNFVTQKAKNSDERELERFDEEVRQEHIRKRLAKFREAKRAELFKGDMVVHKNAFDHSATVLEQDKSVLTNNKGMMGKSMFMTKGNMFS